MVKVAICGAIGLQGGCIASAIERCAAREGVECKLSEFTSAVELVDACSKALLEEPYDMVVCAIDLMGVSGMHVVSELRALYSKASELRVVLCAQSSECAYDAQALGVDGYLVEPIEQADFDRIIGRLLRDIKRVHDGSTVVRCRDCVRRVEYSRLSYAETSGHDQILHHAGNDLVCYVRGSSHELFSLLEGEGRFFKLGSSYIVNLDLVSQLDSKSGVVALVDGVKLPVPVRIRKSLEHALWARAEAKAEAQAQAAAEAQAEAKAEAQAQAAAEAAAQ